jgi:hypothetical protein
MLADYQTEIREHALWIYGMPYSKLPQNAQRAIRGSARQVMENKIFEVTRC